MITKLDFELLTNASFLPILSKCVSTKNELHIRQKIFDPKK